jgi:hypothetical protein
LQRACVFVGFGILRLMEDVYAVASLRFRTLRRTKRRCARFCVCVHALCRRRCLSCQAARFTTALVHVRRRYLLAVFGSARYEESRESVEISRNINGSSLWASIAGNVKVMLVVGSSAVKARARCLLSSRNMLRDFAPALHVSYGRAESRLCMGIPGGCCLDHTEGPPRCCCTNP